MPICKEWQMARTTSSCRMVLRGSLSAPEAKGLHSRYSSSTTPQPRRPGSVFRANQSLKHTTPSSGIARHRPLHALRRHPHARAHSDSPASRRLLAQADAPGHHRFHHAACRLLLPAARRASCSSRSREHRPHTPYLRAIASPPPGCKPKLVPFTVLGRVT